MRHLILHGIASLHLDLVSVVCGSFSFCSSCFLYSIQYPFSQLGTCIEKVKGLEAHLSSMEQFMFWSPYLTTDMSPYVAQSRSIRWGCSDKCNLIYIQLMNTFFSGELQFRLAWNFQGRKHTSLELFGKVYTTK